MNTHLSQPLHEAGPKPGMAPTTPAQRMVSLDVLRGFAVLGILVMNIQAFSMPFSAYMNPTNWGDLTGVNYWVWVLGHVLTDQKFMTIFSMLFGAGLVLFAEHVEARGQSATALHLRRSFWLLLFGLVHAYLLWFGDILFFYAVCAFAVFWLRRCSPRTLLIVGVAMLAVASAINFFAGWSLPYWPEETLAEIMDDWQPGPEKLGEELAAYRGGWIGQLAWRASVVVEFQFMGLVMWAFWRAGGLMLVGMALYKLGVFSALRRPRFYLALIVAAVAVGIPLVTYGVYWNFANQWQLSSMFFGTQFNYWGSVLVGLGWVSVVMLVCQRGALAWLTERLAAVGRMAFSNYILQTLICTTVFYGHGLGLFGQVQRIGQIAIVFGVWAVLLIISPIWLRHFRFGPLEWLWRCLTYGQFQAMRIRVANQSG